MSASQEAFIYWNDVLKNIGTSSLVPVRDEYAPSLIAAAGRSWPGFSVPVQER
jgi:hypothetical protein